MLGLVKKSTLKNVLEVKEVTIDNFIQSIGRKNERIEKLEADIADEARLHDEAHEQYKGMCETNRANVAKLEKYHQGEMYTLARFNVEVTFYEDRSYGQHYKCRATFAPDLYDCRESSQYHRHRFGYNQERHDYGPTKQEINVLKRIFSEVGIQSWHWGSDNQPVAYFSSHDILEIAREVSSCHNTLQGHLDNVLSAERNASIAGELAKEKEAATPETKEKVEKPKL